MPEFATSEISPTGIERAEEYRRRKETSVLAIVFGDVVDSTRLMETWGDERYLAKLENQFQQIESVVHEDGDGKILEVQGDGFLAIFSEPSLAVERCVRLSNSELPFPMRFGIDMGQVAQKRTDGIVTKVLGRHVYRASRVQGVGEPGNVVTTFPVYDCAIGWLRSRPISWNSIGEHHLKGFDDPVKLYAASEDSKVTPELLARTLGRPGSLPQRKALDRSAAPEELRSPASVRKPDPQLPAHRDLLFALVALVRIRWENIRVRLGFGRATYGRKEKLERTRSRRAQAPGDSASPQAVELDPEIELLGEIEYRTSSRTRVRVSPPVNDALQPFRERLFGHYRANPGPFGFRVLWVDDHPENNEDLVLFLSDTRCRIEHAATTAEAIRTLQDRPYDAIISDMERDGDRTAGLELLGWAADNVPSTPFFLFCSAAGAAEYGAEAIEMGATICTPGVVTLFDALTKSLAPGNVPVVPE